MQRLNIKRYQALGAFRLILAVMVMGQHFGWLATPEIGQQLPRYATGDIAVLAFFVLSGFIIVEASTTFYAGRPGAFAVNRMLRIAPPLLLALAFSVGLHFVLFQQGLLRLPPDYGPPGDLAQIFSPRNLAANLIAVIPLAGRVLAPSYSYVPYIWAVAVEVQFYAVLAVLMAAAKAWGRYPLLLAATGVALTAASFAPALADAISLVRYAPYFALGGAFFYAVRGHRRAIMLAMVLAVVCLLRFAGLNDEVYSAMADSLGPRPWIAQYLLLGACIAAIPILYWIPVDARTARADRMAGELSYPLYLNQYAVIILFYSLFQPGGLSFWLSIPAALVLALLAGRIVEPVTLSVRNRIRGASLVEAGVQINA